MSSEVKIEQLVSVDDYRDELCELLIKVVEDGASIGFLPPLDLTEASIYWENVINPEVILYVAKVNNEIVGSIQLHLCGKQNGAHRAEIAKLMTHPDFRRRGIATLLMNQAEQRAQQEGRS
ncbi:MAG: GCN5-related N-acetyltransferase, partial [Paenibacillus sp.]|nr:GCN5-related N-acetyltransferase [Paenibacillus sp.]